MAGNANFCTLNPLTQTNSGTFKEGNLLFEHTSNAWRTTAGTMGMTTGKWYWEAYQHNDVSGNGFPQGIYDMDSGLFVDVQCSDYPGQSNSSFGTAYASYTNTGTYAKWYHNGSNGDLSSLSDGAAGDVWQMAFDADNGKLYIGKNGSWDNSGNPASGTNPKWTSIPSSTWVPITCSYNTGNSEDYPQNFGQDSSFSNRITAGGNADDNGYGDFKYSPPSGFLALCSSNLNISADIDPAQTSTNYPSKQFGAVLYTGNGSSNAITGLGFQPDLVWGKCRSHAQAGILIDSSRGQGLLFSSATNAEQTTNGPFMTSYDSDGFTLASSGSNPNDSGRTYVAWCWRANGGTTSSDSSADITVTRQSNTSGGFAILTYSGNGSDNQTLAHGLGAKPALIIIKNRDTTNGWSVWTQHLGDNSKWIQLDQYAAAQSDSNQFYNAGMTTSNIGVRSGASVNGSGNDLVAYVWAEVEGYSKFGKYEGTAGSDNSFIYTGFRPRMAFFKNIDSDGEWTVFDTARQNYNEMTDFLEWDQSAAEKTQSGTKVDFLSNGMKVRGNGGRIGSSATYIYGAWGDVPFKYNNTF